MYIVPTFMLVRQTYSRVAWGLALLLLPAIAVAQAPGPASAADDRGWSAFGFGPGSPYERVAVVTANFGRERIVQVGLHVNSELIPFGRSKSVNALHVGPGLSRVSRWDRMALAVGPAVVWGLPDAAGTDSRYTTVGVVLSGQAMFTPVPEFGFGLDAFYNLNPLHSGYGVGITFVFEANK